MPEQTTARRTAIYRLEEVTRREMGPGRYIAVSEDETGWAMVVMADLVGNATGSDWSKALGDPEMREKAGECGIMRIAEGGDDA